MFVQCADGWPFVSAPCTGPLRRHGRAAVGQPLTGDMCLSERMVVVGETPGVPASLG